MAMNYTKEFFDREYPTKEAYGRLWGYARKYWPRLAIGVLCGMLTAGTLVPMYGIIQPALAKVEQRQEVEGVIPNAPQPQTNGVSFCEGCGPLRTTAPTAATDKKSKGLLKDYGKLRKYAAKFGFELQGDDETMGLPLLFIIIIGLPLIALLRCGLIFLNHYCLAWAGMKTVRDIRCEMLHHVLRQSMQFHGRINVGQLMSRCAGDPQQVQMIIQTVLQEIAQAPFEIAISVGFIVWTAAANGMLSTLVVLVVGFPLFMLPVICLSKVIRKWSRKALERFSLVGSRIHEILTCIRAVKAYNTEGFEDRRYREANDQTLKATMKTLRWGLLVGPAVETVGIILLCAFLVWCFATNVKLSAVVPMIAPLLIIYKPVKQLSKLQVQVEQGRAALARLWSLMDVHMELPEDGAVGGVGPNTPQRQQNERAFECGCGGLGISRPTVFTDRIVFEDVSFRYDTAETDAVSHASFEIPCGKMVAIVGGTGSGKTTMSGLLSRFYDPTSGRVTLDGVDLRDFRISDLRMLIGAVQQETLLFNDTIEENIKYGSPDATHDEVVAAAKMANAHDFIVSQSEGYARMCGEKGFALSGGERQRIAIARAILRNPPILILDEATSALDTVTEKLVQDALENLMQNRTVFAIAHRLSTIRNADLILVMDKGIIVERGTHDELYAKNGAYRKLCDMQRTN